MSSYSFTLNGNNGWTILFCFPRILTQLLKFTWSLTLFFSVASGKPLAILSSLWAAITLVLLTVNSTIICYLLHSFVSFVLLTLMTLWHTIWSLFLKVKICDKLPEAYFWKFRILFAIILVSNLGVLLLLSIAIL